MSTGIFTDDPRLAMFDTVKKTYHISRRRRGLWKMLAGESGWWNDILYWLFCFDLLFPVEGTFKKREVPTYVLEKDLICERHYNLFTKEERNVPIQVPFNLHVTPPGFDIDGNVSSRDITEKIMAFGSVE